MSEQLKVTSPEEYAERARKASASEDAGFLYKLKKTGAVVRLRHVDMEALAVVGSLPMSLVAAATRSDSETSDKKKPQTNRKPTAGQIEEGIKTAIFMRQMVVENCLEPSIRYFEGDGVYFVNAAGKQVTKVNKDDFMEMFEVISGEEGGDGLNSFRNRKTRRASVAKSGRKTLQSRSVSVEDEREPAPA